MNGYRYKIADTDGKIHTGTMSARSESEVIAFLRARNQFAIEIERDVKKSFLTQDIKIGSGRVGTIAIVVFCRQIAAMLKAGMPIDRALTAQLGQTESLGMREALTKLIAQIKQGMVMSRAMAEQPKVFPEILVRAVEAGEKTGNLDNAFIRMATYFHKALALRRKVNGAMAYPLVVLALTFAISAFLIVVIIPEFAMFLQTSGGELPGLTMFFVNLSDLVREYWYAFIAGMAIIAYGTKLVLGTPTGRLKFDTFKLKIPKVNRLVCEILTARFTRTFSAMVASGIPIVEAIEVSASSMNNKYAQNKVLAVIEEVKKGSPVSEQLRSAKVFPEMMLSMLAIGEETGSMDEMLGKVADYYDEESEAALDKLLAMLGPLMIVMVAAVVGTIVLAMYLPIFDAMTTF